MPREMFLTVGTGRDREDMGKAMALSIRHHRADRVCRLATLKSQEETLPIIRRELAGEAPTLETLLIEDENDAETCQTPGLLIVDEVEYATLRQPESHLVFQVISLRHDRKRLRVGLPYSFPHSNLATAGSASQKILCPPAASEPRPREFERNAVAAAMET